MLQVGFNSSRFFYLSR